MTRNTQTKVASTGRGLSMLLALVLAGPCPPARAGDAMSGDALLTPAQQLALDNAQRAWQRARLLHPSAAQRRAEREQQVFIYVAVTDRDVEMALDSDFERMDSFLFANVIVTDDAGRPLRDPVTGRVVVESDDCD